MIPSNITRQHILLAIDKINSEGVPAERESTKFDLLFKRKRYPPKYVISLANVFANGEVLSPAVFSGGDEANFFLSARDFRTIPKSVPRATRQSPTEYWWDSSPTERFWVEITDRKDIGADL